MLTANELRQTAARSGARDIANVEIDVVLTCLLQLFHERGLVDHLAFKGGTMLRKMVFGPRGRLSTDLDFTRRSAIPVDDLMLLILEALSAPYQGLVFRFSKDKDWYLTEDGCAANPTCSHAANEKGVKIKIQVSTREQPVLPVTPLPQLPQDYFRLLQFPPADIPCLVLEEVIAEKIRAASQRSKIRDLHDLCEVLKLPIHRDRVRTLAVIKLWNAGGPSLDYQTFRTRIDGAADYDIDELKSLLRKDENPEIKTMIERTAQGFRFLEQLTELERVVATDRTQQRRKEAETLITAIREGSEGG